MDYLAGRTLYDVWYGIIDAGIGAGVSKVDFTETTMTWTGLVGEAGTITVPYTVDGNGLMTGGDAPEPGEGFEIVCGSTSQYIKSHHLNAGGVFDNTDLWFFNEADALAYAGTLIEAIAPCTSDLP